MVRRMKNTLKSNTCYGQLHTKVISNSGYTMEQAGKIQGAGLKGYKAALKREEHRKGRLHRSAAGGVAARTRKKLLARSNWFKEQGK